MAQAYETARHSTRDDLLQPKIRRNDSHIKIITRYNNQWNDLYKIFNNNWHVLTPKIFSCITDKPKLVTRRAPNLKDRLVNSHFSRPTNRDSRRKHRGTYPCGSCNICQHMLSGQVFQHSQSGQIIKLKHFIHCKTRNVVYAIMFPCRKLYVGQTTQNVYRDIFRIFPWRLRTRHRGKFLPQWQHIF